MAKNGKAEEKKKINIALQGGGSHGAFSWGVLDRLLEDGRLEIAAVIRSLSPIPYSLLSIRSNLPQFGTQKLTARPLSVHNPSDKL